VSLETARGRIDHALSATVRHGRAADVFDDELAFALLEVVFQELCDLRSGGS